tara:strand:+ start:29 stop:745 length:717 start_codon:yes stop_codon:yes gene_type:complete
MPKSSSSDIPHVSITDHKIAVASKSIEGEEKGAFLGLVCINNDKPTNLSKAKAYLKHFESFDANSILLDSAKMFLDKCDKKESYPFYIQYYYLQKDYKKLINYSKSKDLDKFHNLFTNNILSVTFSRIADSYSHFNFNEKSYSYYLKSLDYSELNLDYQLKTAVLELKMSKFETAKNRLSNIIKLNPNFEKAYFNLGSIYLNVDKDYQKARQCFEKSISLNPDYKMAIENLEYINRNE